MSKLPTNDRRLILISLLALLLLSVAPVSQSQQPNSALAARRAQRLRHGINLSEWFAQVYDPKGYTKEHFETWNTAQDIAMIKAMDFDHVRLSVNPQPMFRRHQADRIPADYLGYLDARELYPDFVPKGFREFAVDLLDKTVVRPYSNASY